MIRTTMNLIVCFVCVTLPDGLAAEPPQTLAEACPQLHIPDSVKRPGADDGPIIIDNLMVQLLAKEGRFAAIASAAPAEGSLPTAADATHKTLRPSKSRDRWRAEHRREVAAIRKLALGLTIAREELKALHDRYFRALSEDQRIRMEPRLASKKLQIQDLDYRLQKRRASFSRMIREARHDGAQPGWFRDLPQP